VALATYLTAWLHIVIDNDPFDPGLGMAGNAESASGSERPASSQKDLLLGIAHCVLVVLFREFHDQHLMTHEKSGAKATAVSPHKKHTNINPSIVFDRAGAAVNSCQTNTPQAAVIMVAPWPIE
jgi:hypothetical protein